MKAVIVCESGYGSTHAIAEAIAKGFGTAEVMVVGVQDASQALVDRADLLVVGGSTHARGMSRPSTRQGAVDAAPPPDSGLTLVWSAGPPGVRDWLGGLRRSWGPAAAFDTRLDGPAVFTGRASKGIARLLRKTGFRVIARPQSFLITKGNDLVAGELDRARAWGTGLAARAGTESG